MAHRAVEVTPPLKVECVATSSVLDGKTPCGRGSDYPKVEEVTPKVYPPVAKRPVLIELVEKYSRIPTRRSFQPYKGRKALQMIREAYLRLIIAINLIVKTVRPHPREFYSPPFVLFGQSLHSGVWRRIFSKGVFDYDIDFRKGTKFRLKSKARAELKLSVRNLPGFIRRIALEPVKKLELPPFKREGLVVLSTLRELVGH